MSENKMKSAYQLAMERLSTEDPAMAEKSLPDSLKAGIAEIRKIYESRIAERRIMLRSKIADILSGLSPEQAILKRNEIEKETYAELETLKQEMASEIKKLRSQHGF